MNGFQKNKNGTAKRNPKPDNSNDQLGENASEEYKPETYSNIGNSKKKGK